MKIRETLEISGTKLLCGEMDSEFNNFVFDTRKVKQGDTFLGFKGENVDGNTFYLEALEKGAKTVVISGIDVDDTVIDKYNNRNILMVDDTTKFIVELATKRREKIKIPIIAVTGSVGKTSTKNIIADVLESRYKVLKTIGNLNTNIGVSLMILSIKDEEIAVLEMGMNQAGEIRTLTNIAKPDVAVITNIGTAHIGNLGSQDNILKAKLEILEGLRGPLIINNDSSKLYEWHKTTSISNKVITYGIDNKSDYEGENIKYNKRGSSFTIKDENVSINVIGKHFIYNSLVAFAIGDLFKIPSKDIKEKLKKIPLEPNRMELINTKDITIINDSYNSSYDALIYSIQVLQNFSGRKIALLGDVLELGTYSEEIHRNIGKYVAFSKVDLLITVGVDAKYINEEAIKEGFNKNNSFYFRSNKEAIEFIDSIRKEGDTILIKASNGMHFIEIVDALKEEK